jgi:hypothetical protein
MGAYLKSIFLTDQSKRPYTIFQLNLTRCYEMLDNPHGILHWISGVPPSNLSKFQNPGYKFFRPESTFQNRIIKFICTEWFPESHSLRCFVIFLHVTTNTQGIDFRYWPNQIQHPWAAISFSSNLSLINYIPMLINNPPVSSIPDRT